MNARRRGTLLARTGVTLTAAFAVFMLIAVAAMVNYILIPLARQGADDLAALMVLAAQSWVELPPQTRPFLEQELMHEYQLKLSLTEDPLPKSTSLLPFLRFLEKALERRVRQPVPIRQRSGETVWFCADIPMGVGAPSGSVFRANASAPGRPPRPCWCWPAAGSSHC